MLVFTVSSHFCTALQVILLFLVMTGYTGVNLLIGTENGLVLLDRSGQGKSEFSLSHTCLCLSPVTAVCNSHLSVSQSHLSVSQSSHTCLSLSHTCLLHFICYDTVLLSLLYVMSFATLLPMYGDVSTAVYPMISRRRFQQMEVLEGLNILVTISGRKNKLRVYYLSWLKTKILKTESVGYSLLFYRVVSSIVCLLQSIFRGYHSAGFISTRISSLNVNISPRRSRA